MAVDGGVGGGGGRGRTKDDSGDIFELLRVVTPYLRRSAEICLEGYSVGEGGGEGGGGGGVASHYEHIVHKFVQAGWTVHRYSSRVSTTCSGRSIAMCSESSSSSSSGGSSGSSGSSSGGGGGGGGGSGSGGGTAPIALCVSRPLPAAVVAREKTVMKVAGMYVGGIHWTILEDIGGQERERKRKRERERRMNECMFMPVPYAPSHPPLNLLPSPSFSSLPPPISQVYHEHGPPP